MNWRNDAEGLLFETPIIPNDADTAWMTPFISKGGFSPLSGAGDDDDATDVEDVVVVGDWEFPPLIPYSPGGGSPPDGSGDPTGGGGGGGGGTPQPPPDTACQVDEAMDGIAKLIEAMIKAMPDWNAREYGALILRDANGNIHVGQLMRGETMSESLLAGRDAPRLAYQSSIPSGWTVVGTVHSRPDEGYDNLQDIENRYPSSYAGGGNYGKLQNFVSVSQNFASPATFDQYILGPDGILREFNWSEGVVGQVNDSRPNRSDLSSDRPCT